MQREGLAEQQTRILKEGRPLLPSDLGTCLAKEKLPVQGPVQAEAGHPLLEREFLLWKRGGSLFPLKKLKCSKQLPC